MFTAIQWTRSPISVQAIDQPKSIQSGLPKSVRLLEANLIHGFPNASKSNCQWTVVKVRALLSMDFVLKKKRERASEFEMPFDVRDSSTIVSQHATRTSPKARSWDNRLRKLYCLFFYVIHSSEETPISIGVFAAKKSTVDYRPCQILHVLTLKVDTSTFFFQEKKLFAKRKVYATLCNRTQL